MPVNVTEPLYTVEQLGLIKRLRETGISRRQVEHVFDAYDRLDRELGTLFNIPAALELHAQALQQIQQLALSMAQQQQQGIPAPPHTGLTTPGKPGQSGYPITPGSGDNDRSPRQVLPLGNGDGRVGFGRLGGFGGLGGFRGFSGTNSTLGQTAAAYLQPEGDSQELLDFASCGEAACCEEIRSFVVKNGIKQHQVALLAGICQTYVSRYMKGDFTEMSERSRRTIQKWYLAFRHNPAGVARAASQVLTFNGSHSSPGGGGGGGSSPSAARRPYDAPPFADFLGSPAAARRERFVFRPSQVEVLERHFFSNSYPSHEARADIAAECSAIAAGSVGQRANERDGVSVSVISNWFANKRKDLKRAAREGGVDLSGLLMSRRGRPPRQPSFKTEPPGGDYGLNYAELRPNHSGSEYKADLTGRDYNPSGMFKGDCERGDNGDYSPDESISEEEGGAQNGGGAEKPIETC